jgi:hypothetical protein
MQHKERESETMRQQERGEGDTERERERWMDGGKELGCKRERARARVRANQ